MMKYVAWAKLPGILALALMMSAAVAKGQNQNFLQEAMPLPQGRQMHGAAVANDYLFAISGAIAQPTTTVMKARILPNGQLAGWEQARPLNSPRLYIGSSTLVLGNIIYVLGGSDGILSTNNYNNAVYAKPDPNGNLSQWIESAPWPGPGLTAPTAVSTPGYIHLVGGLDPRDRPTSDIYSIRVLSTGHLGSQWEIGNPIPQPLWYHHAAVSSGRVYIWGGLEAHANTSATIRVYSAPILSSGRIGNWREESSRLPQPFYASSTAVAGPYLISFSPRGNKSEPSSDIWWAAATMEGLSSWSLVPTGVPNRVYHASATDYKRGIVYLVAGRESKTDVKTLIPRVFFFKLSREARDAAYAGHSGATGSNADSLDVEGWESQVSPSRTDAPTEDAAPDFNPLLAFKSFDEARQSGRPIVYYFHTNQTQVCRDQMRELDSPEFATLTKTTEFVLISVDSDPQFAQQMGIWRVPTWVMFDSKGTEVERLTGIARLADLKAKLSL